MNLLAHLKMQCLYKNTHLEATAYVRKKQKLLKLITSVKKKKNVDLNKVTFAGV